MTDTTPSILPEIQNFVLFLKSNNYSPQTVFNYQRDLQILEKFLNLKQISLSQLDRQKIVEFKAYLTSSERITPGQLQIDSPLSPASINRCLSSIRAYLRFLAENEIPIPVIPEQFKMVKKEKTRPNVAELEELIALIEAPSHLESDPVIATRNRAVLEVLFATGMRISELVSLNKRDVNRTGRILITGKGRKQRFVYLTERSKAALDKYMVMRDDFQQALFVPTKGRTINQTQRRLSVRYIQEKIKQYREALKIDIPVSPHSLRHGFATYLAENGASPVAIQILLGHESLNTTTRYVNASDRFAEDSHKKYHPLALEDDEE